MKRSEMVDEIEAYIDDIFDDDRLATKMLADTLLTRLEYLGMMPPYVRPYWTPGMTVKGFKWEPEE